jgi:hypothetical protein
MKQLMRASRAERAAMRDWNSCRMTWRVDSARRMVPREGVIESQKSVVPGTGHECVTRAGRRTTVIELICNFLVKNYDSEKLLLLCEPAQIEPGDRYEKKKHFEKE